jgi:hypothetical protein
MQKTPPRFVPTLTQVIPKPPRQTVAAAAIAPAPSINTVQNPQPSPEQIAQQLRQQLLVRTRQYMDIELQRRIRETVSQLALEHAHKLFEELQPHLESTIRAVIDEAVAQAVAHAAAHAP